MSITFKILCKINYFKSNEDIKKYFSCYDYGIMCNIVDKWYIYSLIS